MMKIFRAALHFPVGLVAGALCICPVASALFTLGFFVYELNEDFHLKDCAYLDIFGWLVGFPVGAAAAIWWQL